ncbi:MAG TPA: pyridoxine 5'-phosphate synthase [Pyrinomonadaceae bacterium]|nr:pyridoxine 5'-phosphate synthase [Pyrinomonadaceae bacterium]
MSETKKEMTRLSVNINKYALVRNSRGGHQPNIIQIAKDCEKFGAQGITIHPRQDERHIRYSDVRPLKEIVTTEFNIEGFPDQRFMEMVLEVQPHQCTLVPDASNQLTSDHGWDTNIEKLFLTDVVGQLQEKGIRVSLFVDPKEDFILGAKDVGADRVELYTGPYAEEFHICKEEAIVSHIHAAKVAHELGLGINAGHDLNLDNLNYYKSNIANLDEVSIGHAIICDAIYLGLETTIKRYLEELK